MEIINGKQNDGGWLYDDQQRNGGYVSGATQWGLCEFVTIEEGNGRVWQWLKNEWKEAFILSLCSVLLQAFYLVLFCFLYLTQEVSPIEPGLQQPSLLRV